MSLEEGLSPNEILSRSLANSPAKGTDLWSISSTFYARIFRTNVFLAAFL